MCGQLCGLCGDGSVAVCVWTDERTVMMIVLLCVCVDSCEDYVVMVVLLCVCGQL